MAITDLGAINKIVQNDPEIQRLIRIAGTPEGTAETKSVFDNPLMNIAARLKELGVEIPKGYWVKDGKFQQQSWFNRNMDWVVPSMIIGGGFGASFLPGVGLTGGATGASAPAATAAATGTNAAAIGTPAAAAAPAAAGSNVAAEVAGGVAAAKAAPSLWSKFAKVAAAVGPVVGTVVGAKLSSDANKNASDAQLKAAQEALAFEKQVYEQRQRQLAPAIGVGNAATVRMGELMGIQTPQGGYSSSMGTGPGGVAITNVGAAPPISNIQARPSTPAENATAQQGLVTLISPDGKSERNVPADQIAHYVQQGARLKTANDVQGGQTLDVRTFSQAGA